MSLREPPCLDAAAEPLGAGEARGWSRRGALLGGTGLLATGFASGCETTPVSSAPSPDARGEPTPSETPVAEPARPARRAYAANYPTLLDTASDTRASLTALKAAGVKTIVRYYATAAQPEVPQKQLTEAERDAVLGAGLNLAIAFQYYNNRPENIHGERGKADGATCLDRIARFSQPKGSAIYFGIDGDWPDKAADTLDYFREAGSALKPAGYRVGVYGSGATCARVLEAGLADLAWLAYAPAWTGSASFYNSNRWTLFQAGLDTNAAGGLRVDTNLIRAGVTDFGQWGAGGVGRGHGAGDAAALADNRRFIASKAAKLHVAPDDASQSIDNPRFRKSNVVRLIATQGEWAEVDVNETGRRTGWCRLSHLVDLSRRPDYHAAG